MIAIWRQLIWKECREQMWKTISLTAIVLAVEAYWFFSEGQTVLAGLGFGLMCGVPGAFFIALGVAAGERTAGSLDFMRSFPLARWKWAAARVLIGAIAAIVPIAVAAAVMVLFAWCLRSAADAPRFLREASLTALCCLNVYGWTAAAGVRRTNELRAGLAAICLFVGWWALLVIIDSVFTAASPTLVRLLMLPSPAGLALWPDPSNPRPGGPFTAESILCAQMAGLAATAWWFTRRYGELTAAENRSPAGSGPALPLALRPPRRSRLASLIWKESRESGPVCLAGLVIVAAVLLPPMIGAAREERNQGLAIAANLIVVMGTLMGLVLGVGGHAADLEAGVWQFWRSRPMRPAAWFWIKYIVGAAVLLIAFDGALTVLDLLAGGVPHLLHDSSWWIGPLLHLFAYSTAVWMVCQLRQPIYAGILSLAVVIGVLTLGDLPVQRPLLTWLSFSQIAKTCPTLGASAPDVVNWLMTSYARFAAPMLALAACAALLGWFAAVRGTPWSRVSRAVPG